MEYSDNAIALECGLRKQLTKNQLSALGDGASFEVIGDVMDGQNNLLDDMDAADPDILQEAREFIGSVPHEVAMHYLDEAVEDGQITAYHGCANLSRQGYAWCCLILRRWRPSWDIVSGDNLTTVVNTIFQQMKEL